MKLERSWAGPFALRVFAAIALLAVPAAADHPKDFRTALEGLKSNNLKAVDKVFLKDASRDGSDRLLALYELGSFYHLGGNPGKSMDFFNSAEAVARVYEGQAVVSAGAAGRNAGAVLLNDSTLKYTGFGYDKVMSRTLNAVNFVLVGNMEGARVELRKAEEYQRLERERHQQAIQRSAADPPGVAQAARIDNPALQANYGRMFDSVKNVRNSFENAFTYYFASQVFLARGEEGLNDAMVEIKRAFELAPQCPAVREAYLEIARAQGGFALDQAKASLRLPDPDPGPEAKATGSVVVVFETGLVPPLEEARVDLLVENRLYSLAVPIYRDSRGSQAPLAIQTPSRTVFTSPILNTRDLAVKSLQERMPGIITRGLLGAVAKGVVQEKTEREFGPIGGLFSKLASAVLTSADRRSWLSLPAEVQVACFNLDPGRTPLVLQGPGWGDTVTLNITPGSRTLLLVRALPGFKRIDFTAFEAEGAPVGKDRS